MKCKRLNLAISSLLTTVLLCSTFIRHAASFPRARDEANENQNLNELADLPLETDSMGRADIDRIMPTNTSVCFPYFISLDIEGLLSQASQMLSRAANPRQKSWLQFFVARLDSLSKQLKNLPVEHKNMCFLKRQKILSESMPQASSSAMSPEEQLRFAKEVFNAPVEPDRLQLTGPQQEELQAEAAVKEYMQRGNLSPMSSRILLNGQRDARTLKQNSAMLHKQMEGSLSDVEHKTIPSSDMQMPFLIIPGDRVTKENMSKLPQTTSSPEKPFIPNMPPEVMPFLPRSTRKTIPLNVLERLKKTHFGLRPYIFNNPNQVNYNIENAKNTVSQSTTTERAPSGNQISTTPSENVAEFIVYSVTSNQGLATTKLSEKLLKPNLDSGESLDSNIYDEAVIELHANENPALTSTSSINTTPVKAELDERLRDDNVRPINTEHMTKTENLSERARSVMEFSTQTTLVNADVTTTGLGSSSFQQDELKNENRHYVQGTIHTSKFLSPFPAVRNHVVEDGQVSEGEDDDAAMQLKALRLANIRKDTTHVPSEGKVH